MSQKHIILITVIFSFLTSGFSQNCNHNYTHQDTLRGTITPERAWWDLKKYELSIEVLPESKTIVGSNIITYEVITAHDLMQIDLQSPLTINNVTQQGDDLIVTKDGSAHFIKIKQPQIPGKKYELKIEYSGTPTEAKHAPWDGGLTWSKDENGNHFIATSCQGIGASIWWPCKDHMYDEPDNGIVLSATIPENLTAVSNGKLIGKTNNKNSTTFKWQVTNPINNYGVNLNIGDYVNFSEEYDGLNGKLDMNYWVLRPNLEKAKTHFNDAKKMMQAFEHWFGPYPFYDDGYKLVEVPYLGMEHQSSVTYGNGYENGYLGRDRSQTGWGLKFDFIIIHESGHEWFANNITYKDMADMWIHESFTAYSESLFLEYHYGKTAGYEYNRGKRSLIQNESPLITDYNVNASPPGDIYAKGANMLHTLRQIVDNDEKWRDMLIGLNKTFYHSTVSTKVIEAYIQKELNLDLKAFFNQYLRDRRVPTFEYKVHNKKLVYRWVNCIPEFDIPLKILVDGKEKVLLFNPNASSNSLKLDNENSIIEVNPDFYIYTINSMGK